MILKVILIVITVISLALAALSFNAYDWAYHSAWDSNASDLADLTTIVVSQNAKVRSPQDSQALSVYLLLMTLSNTLTMYDGMSADGRAVYRQNLDRVLRANDVFDFPGGRPMQQAFREVAHCLHAHPAGKPCGPLVTRAVHSLATPTLSISDHDAAAGQARAANGASGTKNPE